MSADKEKLLVIDQHEVVRLGLRAMFADSTKLLVVGDYGDLDTGIKAAVKLRPTVILLDLHLNQSAGPAALEHCKKELPQIPVVVFAQVENTSYLARAMAMGAHGLLLKSQSRDEIEAMLCRAARNQMSWSRGEQRKANSTRVGGKPQLIGGVAFTGKELEVLRLLIEGLTNKEIAQIMKISYETVKEHIQHILRKIQVTDRTQAAVWAIRQGITGANS